jgi:hypothetical protein
LDASHTFYVYKVEHGDLPGNAAVQKQVVYILNGQDKIADGIVATPFPDSDGWSWSSCSPIRTHIMDDAGNMNGLDGNGTLHEEIDDSNQFRFPENEGGFMPFDKTYTVTIDATGNGLFTLQFDHVAGPDDSTVDSIVYSGVPVSAKSHGQLTLSPTNPAPALSLDIDGDGKTDFTVAANQPASPKLFPAVLINVVQNFQLPAGISTSLLAKLRAAAASLARANTNAARGQLTAFINEVSAQRGKALTPAQADTLTALGQTVLSSL